MSLQSDLYTRLTTHAGLVALIGTRVYAVIGPQGMRDPYCVYSMVSGGRSYSHQGYSNYRKPRIQVSCYAKTYETAKEIAAQVINAIESWHQANDSVASGLNENEIDLYDVETGLHQVPVDFFVTYYG